MCVIINVRVCTLIVKSHEYKFLHFLLTLFPFLVDRSIDRSQEEAMREYVELLHTHTQGVLSLLSLFLSFCRFFLIFSFFFCSLHRIEFVIGIMMNVRVNGSRYTVFESINTRASYRYRRNRQSRLTILLLFLILLLPPPFRSLSRIYRTSLFFFFFGLVSTYN